MARAVEAFHERHPDRALEINVTRHPYSFVGDRPAQPQKAGELDGIGTEASQLRTFADQMQGRFPAATAATTPAARRERMRPFLELGAAAGIEFELDVVAQYQPVESQRLLLWAGRFGLQEEFMGALNRRHFERGESASARATLLRACADVGLDEGAAAAFLETDELERDVWSSYGETIRTSGIRSIPLFAFSVPALGAIGGPFRAAGRFEAYVVRGSSDAATFSSLFELILRDVEAGERVYDAPAFPFRRDEWWGRR